MEIKLRTFTQEELDFPTKDSYPKEDLIRVQERLLEMADAIIGILDAHKIDYMITYGTLLGAIRHQGFIPWDDDFDIFIFEKDYKRALEALRKELPSDMIVHDEKTDPIYWPYWSRVRDLNSETYAELYPKDNAYKYRGINFDLYVLEYVDKDKIKQTELAHNIDYFENIQKAGFISEAERDEKLMELKAEMDRLKTLPNTEHGKAHAFCGWYECSEETELFPLKEYEFEGRLFKGPADFDTTLRKMYGDYLSLPEYEDRKPHYSWVRFDGDRNA